MPAKPRTTRRSRSVRNDDVTKELAHGIRERIELLTSIIGGPPDVTRASTAHAVLAELIGSIGVLERAFYLLDQFIQRELAAGRLNPSSGMTPEQWARVAAGALDDAQQGARRLRFAVFGAKAAIGELQGPSPPPMIAGSDFPAPISHALQADQSPPNPSPKPKPCNGKVAKTHVTTTDANQQPDQPAHHHGGTPWSP